MTRRAIALVVTCGLTSMALMMTIASPTELTAASKSNKTSKRPIHNPKFDPAAEQVDLFEAMDAGQVTVRLIPKDANGGNVLIENKTDKPLSVKIPDAVVGVSIHSQFVFPGANQVGADNNGNGNQGIAGMAGNQQNVGGGVNQGQGNGQLPGQGNAQGPNNGPGFGFFSIPAEKVISLSFNSVCLEHGKPEPDSSCKYTLAPVSKLSSDPVLYQLLATVGTGKVDTQAAQAVAWHLTDKMSFQELAEKTNSQLGGILPTPYFTRNQIVAAKQLLAQSTERAEKAETVATSDKTLLSSQAANNSGRDPKIK